MFEIFCTTDDSGATYATGAIRVATAQTLDNAANEIRTRVIAGIRGPGCFTARANNRHYYLDASRLCPEGTMQPAD